MPSGKPSGWPPLSGGLKARLEYQLPSGKVSPPGLAIKIRVRFAELEGREGLGIGAGVDHLLHVVEDLDHARVLVGQLAGPECCVVVRPELAQQQLVGQVRAGIGPVADALHDRRDAHPRGSLDHLEKLVLGQLLVVAELDAGLRQHLVHELLVLVQLDRERLHADAVDLAVEGPGALGEVLEATQDLLVLDRRHQSALDELHPIRLEIDDVRALAGLQRGRHRREQRVLLVEGHLEVDARVLGLEDLLDLAKEAAHAFVVGEVAPDGERRVLGRRRRAVEAPDGRRHGQTSQLLHDLLAPCPGCLRTGALPRRSCAASTPLLVRGGGRAKHRRAERGNMGSVRLMEVDRPDGAPPARPRSSRRGGR